MTRTCIQEAFIILALAPIAGQQCLCFETWQENNYTHWLSLSFLNV
ncbi:MAG: hypothetical protein Q8941_12450 [Bacteroidota bacterium]|nr:hypothetical protein [Bacteroidota bacterium]